MVNSSRLKYEIIGLHDLYFINQLFSSSEVRKYYVLREDHSKDLSLFLHYMVSSCEVKRSLIYRISKQDNTPIGIIGGELNRDFENNVAWNISYAIIPEFWNNGYATEALKAFTEEIKQYSISTAFLDISDNNESSIRVAEKAGYIKDIQKAHFDPEHEELEILFHWNKKLHSSRDHYFSMAISAFRQKDYLESEKLFTKALEEVYEGGPNTDALCYSNMGMVCTSYGNYQKAFHCLKKAQSLGLNNPSIMKELQWLKDNASLY